MERSRKVALWLLTLLLVPLVALGITLAVTALTAGERPAPARVSASAFATTDGLIRRLQWRLSSRPEDAVAYGLLGSAYLQKARETGDPAYYSLAEAALNKALTLDPEDAEAIVGLGSLALSRHQFQEAFDWGERAKRINPHKALANGVIADALVELGRYPEAWDALQRMMELRPDLSSYSRVSYARELTGDIPGAIEAMKQALEAGGPNAENTSWARVQLGNLYFNSGDLRAAEAQYGAALRSFPGYIHAQAGLARVAAARGHHQESIDLYQQVVERVPLPEYVMALGVVYAAAGRPLEAAKMYALVRVQQRLYQANGVNTDLEMALFDADHSQNLQEALAAARQEMARRPSIRAADVLAWTLYRAGDYLEASRYAQEALRLGTKDALMRFHAGMIAYRLDDRARARVLLEQALSLNPYFSVLYRDEALRTVEALASPGQAGGA